MQSPSTDDRAEAGTIKSGSWEARWIIIFISVGLAIRALRYLLKFPIWGDEAMLCVNFFDRDYAGLIRPLESHQVAPLLFLWIELTAIKLLGFNEWSLRLFPLVCSLASVAVFYRFARRTLYGLGLVLALGFFCVSYAGVRYASEIKPYGVDLFVSTLLLALATRFIQEPRATRWLWILAALMPILLGISYPAVFVAGGVSVCAALVLWNHRSLGGCLAWFSYNVTLVASFSFFFLLAGKGQGDAESHVMATLWGDAFPPTDSFFAMFEWLLRANAGPIFSHPIGGNHYGSAGTLLCFVVGVIMLGRRKQYPLLALCLTTFGLNLIAAAMHRYPYGGHVRLAMHLMPLVCLFAGQGAATILQGLASLVTRWRFAVHLLGTYLGQQTRFWQPAATAVCVGLVLLAIVFLGRDFYRPGKEAQEIRKRDFANWFWGSMARDHEVVCMKTDLHICFSAPGNDWHNYISPVFLCNERIYSARVARGEKPDFSRVSRTRPLAVVQYFCHLNPYDKVAFDAWLHKTQQQYEHIATHRYPLPQDNDTDKVLDVPDYIEVYEFVPRDAAKLPAATDVHLAAKTNAPTR